MKIIRVGGGQSGLVKIARVGAKQSGCVKIIRVGAGQAGLVQITRSDQGSQVYWKSHALGQGPQGSHELDLYKSLDISNDVAASRLLKMWFGSCS